MADTEHDQHPHPTVAQYVEIGVILAVLTAIEVGLFYAERGGLSEQITVPSLLFLTVLKFGLVVLWFMHLRFDNRIFRRLFVSGLLLALIVYAVVIATFAF